MKPALSPKDLALAIGVSESSLKRWADDGRLRFTRTAGGHRRIAVGEAVRFIRETGALLVQPEALGLRELATTRYELTSAVTPEERLLGYLRDGRVTETRSLILTLYLTGWSIAELADGPIQLAMERLGELWKHDQAGIFVEHRATEICVQAVQHLRSLFEPADTKLLALGCAPAGDPYLLPTLLAAIALSSEGFQTVNLGPDTPFDALGHAVQQCRPALVWLSISSVADPEHLAAEVLALARRLAEPGIPLIVGGQALPKIHLPPAANLHLGRSLGELVAYAKGLRAAASDAIGIHPIRLNEPGPE